jgi:hypothetical protein
MWPRARRPAVDVGDLERNHLSGAQAGAIGHAQRRLVLEPRGGIEQPCHFLYAEDDRQLAWFVDDMGVLDDLVAPERDPEIEPQRSPLRLARQNQKPTMPMQTIQNMLDAIA